MSPSHHLWLLGLVLAACETSGPARPAETLPTGAAVAGAVSLPSPDSSRTSAPSFRIREWTIDDGLPTPVRAVAQTPDGYLWAATNEGLARFDGVRFTRVSSETTPVFRDDDLLGLYVTQSGDLWVGAKGSWTYRLRDGGWTAHPVDMKQDWIQGFAEDGDGTLWAVSSGESVFQFEEGTWRRLDQGIKHTWPPFAVDPSGSVWTYLDPEDAPGLPATSQGVVARWNGSRFVPPSDWRLAGFGDTQHGPVFYRRTAETQNGRARVDLTDAAGAVLGWVWERAEPARVRLIDRAGRAWVHIERDGLSEFAVEREGEVLARIRPEGATSFWQVFEDRQGAVWVHTRSTGLFQITEEPFRRFTSEDGVPRYARHATPGAGGGVIVSAASGEGEPRVAAIRGGAVETDTYRLSPAPGRAAGHTAPDGTTEIGNVFEDRRGRRWGAVKPYLVRLEGGRAEIAFQAQATIWATELDPRDDDVLWIGDYGSIRDGVRGGGHLYRFDARTRTATDSYLLPATIRDLHFDPAGRLWIGTHAGAAVMETGGAPRMLADSAIAGQVVRSITDGTGGAVWVATETGGLVRVRDGEACALRRAHGLPSDYLSAVLLDDLGYMWLSGRRELYRLRLADAEAVLDGTRDRVDVVTLTPSAGHLGAGESLTEPLRAPDGSLWLPSYKGVTRVDPAFYARQFATPAPALVEEIETEADGTFEFADGLRLPTGARTLTVHYTSPDLLAPDQVRFRTRLDGHDEDWVDRGTERRAVYGGLAPGRYTLHVQAMNAGGVWSEPLAAPAFVVPARFTETGWFGLVVVLGLAGLMGLAYRARVRLLKERQHELEATVAQRTADLETEKETVAAQAAELRTLDEAKSRLFANVSHEFRTPLQLILGPLADVAEGLHGDVPDAVRDQVRLASRNGRRLLALVEQLLALARSDAGELTVDPVRLDAAVFAARVAEAFGPLAEREGIHFETDLTAARGTFDPVAVETALANLLANAFSFTPADGTVTLALTPASGDAPLAFHVRDTGPGLAPEDAARVFDRFFQADDSSTRRGSGTGIGLSLVREIARLHGGDATVQSVPGEGATFSLTLPVRAAAPEALGAPELRTAALLAASGDGGSRGDGSASGRARGDGSAAGDGRLAAPPLPPEAPPDTPRVLVVDDNADLRALVRRHLDADYVVEEAADGNEALALAQARVPDAVVSDVMMPGLDGLGLVRALRADPETDFVPVLLLTARAAVTDTVDGLGAGADDYLAKPFDPRELRARVDALLEGRRRLRERWGAAPEADGLPVGLASGASAEQHVLVAQLVDVIDARLDDEEFSVDALAEAVGMSRATLYRRLRGALEGSPADLLREVRLARAATLLASGAGTVSEVAYGVGFKGVSHFAARFRERYGATPSAYARQRASA